MFPAELQGYKSWVVWRYEQVPGRVKATKIPYSPQTGAKADTTDPTTWGSYHAAKAYCDRSNGYFDGIGFVLSDADPYTVIDLDDPLKIELREKIVLAALEDFKHTYIERSPSKMGYHIWLKGHVENERKRDEVFEVYSRNRYFTMTSDVYNDAMIEEMDYELVNWWYWAGGTKAVFAQISEGRPEQWMDNEVYDMACKAEGERNPGLHFHDLFSGDWRKWHDNQSAADIALCNFLVFYSRNPDQVKRLFLQSNLGKRAKAHRAPSKNKQLGYLDETIQKAFDKLPPEINMDQLMGNLEKQLEEERQRREENPIPMLGDGWSFPPGLMGDIADFIYKSAPRPVREVALGAAIGLMAGIAGRSYNVSNTGLNQYILVLAKTGVGKEAAKSGISRLISAVQDESRERRVAVASAFIGPSTIASGQGLAKYLTTNQCFVSVLGEFGLTLQQICSPMANSSQIMMRQLLLDLYNKSGIHDTLEATAAAQKDNSHEPIRCPNFSILAETTPDSYFPNLTDTMVSQGLIPRFMSIEYKGARPAMNKGHDKVKPTEELVERVISLMTSSLVLQQNMKAVTVKFTPEAEAAADAFDKYVDQRHRDSDTEVARHLWTRAHMKLLKLAALIAVGINLIEPTVEASHIEWAKHFVEADIVNVLGRFDAGQVGYEANELQQIKVVCEAVKDYVLRPYDDTMQKYQVKEALHKGRLVTWSYLQSRLAQKACFKKDKMGPTIALKRTMDNLVLEGALQKVSGVIMLEKFNSTAQAYAILDLGRFVQMI